MLTNELANLKHAANRYINRCLDEWELPLTVSGRSACDWSERGRGKIDSWIHLPDHRNVLVLLNTFHLRQQMRAFQTHKMSHRLNCVLVVCLHELLNAARPSLSSGVTGSQLVGEHQKHLIDLKLCWPLTSDENTSEVRTLTEILMTVIHRGHVILQRSRSFQEHLSAFHWVESVLGHRVGMFDFK